MTVTIYRAENKSDTDYVDRLFPRFFNKDRLPKMRKQSQEGTIQIDIAKKGGKRIGFVIWHEISKDWVYIDFIAATGYGKELINRLHELWQKHGYKGVNLDTFIYDGELPRLASSRRLNFFYQSGYTTDVTDHPTPGHVVFHMTHKFKTKAPESKRSTQKIIGGNSSRRLISNMPRGY